MGGYQRRGRNYTPYEGVFASRSARPNQRTYDEFLDTAAVMTAGRIAILAAGSTHLTMLGTYGVKERMRQAGYSCKDERQFCGDLTRHLRNAKADKPARTRTVRLDENQPLKWQGPNADKLSLNIEFDDNLWAERALIDDFLIDRFGDLPNKRKFTPHITVGHANTRVLTAEEREDPLELFVGEIGIPATITMNGLVTAMGSIHGRDEFLTIAA